MEIKIGYYYNVKWNDKVIEHCQLVGLIPETNLAVVNTPTCDTFEIHTDYLELVETSNIETKSVEETKKDDEYKKKYLEIIEKIEKQLEECQKVLNNEYSLKREITKANTIIEALQLLKD